MKLKKFAWDFFEETGDPEAYLLYKELRGFEEYADEGELLPEMKADQEDDGVCKNIRGGHPAE